MTLREAAKERRRRRILDAARVLIGRGGMEELSMRRLAHQAQVSTRTLYNLYGAKEDILFALMAEAMASLDEILHSSGDSDPLSRSRTLVQLSLDRLCERESLYKNLLRQAQLDPGRAREPLLMAKMRSLHENAISDAMREGQLESGFAVRVIAQQLVLAYGQGVRLWANGVFDQAALRAHARYTWAITLYGLAKGPSRSQLAAEIRAIQPEIERVVDRFDRVIAGQGEACSSKLASAELDESEFADDAYDPDEYEGEAYRAS